MVSKTKTDSIKAVSELEKGEEAIVVEIKTEDDSVLRKLMAMGVLPGIKLIVLQRFPSFLFQVGYTKVAVDKDIASMILVSI
ncbi:FeoA family protein [Clostridiaceae bacterium M8S5]|nr:FeoA family protein [Clostridiaceae bacterium M8S5]